MDYLAEYRRLAYGSYLGDAAESQEEGIKNFFKRVMGQHRKCPNDTHWNDKHAKCMPLPGKLRARYNKAHKQTTDAKDSQKSFAETDHADPTWYHQKSQAAQQHAHAALLHQKTAKSLTRAGFKDLADVHKQTASSHADVSKNISKVKNQAKKSFWKKIW